MIWQTVSTSVESTEQLGELFGARLKGGETLELSADLGGGKTTFVKGLARGLGYNGNVQSPTFTLSREYECRDGLSLHHYDLYRLGEAGVLGEELAESIADRSIVTVVEWGGVASYNLPEQRFVITFKPSRDDANERIITFHYFESATKFIKELENVWVNV